MRTGNVEARLFDMRSEDEVILFSKKLSLRKLLQTRNTKNDRLKFIDFQKEKDLDIAGMFMSNIERVKESLRVLEECCKIVDADASLEWAPTPPDPVTFIRQR